MSKLKNPLLSIGARGTIADSLTFQKRGRSTIARQKPTPIDPKSPAQLAQRQRYKDAVAVWHALSTAEKEAWRGVCPGLTAYQCFMRSELKYVPPLLIDIGLEAIDRIGFTSPGQTLINKDNPANASGTIDTVKIFALADWDLLNCFVGTFYTTNGDTLKCRDSVAIGTVTSGSQRTFSGLSISVEAGDYIGIYYTAGYIETSPSGYAGVWYYLDEIMTPGEERNFSTYGGDGMSLYGTGAG